MNKNCEPAERAIAVTVLRCRPHSRAEISIHVDLGFRSRSLASPQASCLRLPRRLVTHGETLYSAVVTHVATCLS